MDVDVDVDVVVRGMRGERMEEMEGVRVYR